MLTRKAALIRMYIIDDKFSYTIMLQWIILQSNNSDTVIIVMTIKIHMIPWQGNWWHRKEMKRRMSIKVHHLRLHQDNH